MIVALIFGLILGQTLVPLGLKFKAHSRKPQITCKLKMCFLPLVGIGLIFLLRSPPEVKAEIQVVPIPREARCSDKLAWKFSSKVDFDMRSAYILAIDSPGNGSFSSS